MDRVATFVRGIVLVNVVVVDEAVTRVSEGEVAKYEPSKVADLPELTAVSQADGWVTADSFHQAAVVWTLVGRDRHREGQ